MGAVGPKDKRSLYTEAKNSNYILYYLIHCVYNNVEWQF
jgi:hypothetical protein